MPLGLSSRLVLNQCAQLNAACPTASRFRHSVPAVRPIFVGIEATADQAGSLSLACQKVSRAARSLTSGENPFPLPVTVSSHAFRSPANAGRFTLQNDFLPRFNHTQLHTRIIEISLIPSDSALVIFPLAVSRTIFIRSSVSSSIDREP